VLRLVNKLKALLHWVTHTRTHAPHTRTRTHTHTRQSC
jgi:hypothetical protein